MDNSNSKSTNPRDPEYYKDGYPDRLTPPVKTAADEVTFAVSNELFKKVIGKIVTVKYNARIKDKSGVESLFLPVFIELREDKDKAESSKSIK